LATIKGHSDEINAITFSPDNKILATGSTDRTVKVWNVATAGEVFPRLIGHHSPIQVIAFSPDSKTVATGSSDDLLKIWDVASGRELKTLGGFADVRAVMMLPDNKIVAIGNEELERLSSNDETTTYRYTSHGKLLNAITGQEFARLG